MATEPDTAESHGVSKDSSHVEDENLKEEEKRKARASRFNVAYQAGRGRGRQKARETKQEGFKTGLNLFDPEEQAKKENRAARFATSSELIYEPIVDEEDVKRRERAARFGTEFYAVDHSGLQNEDLLEQRKDHKAAVQRRPDAIHLYGVDRMSTKDCLQYFEEYGPGSVEWLDDSSCNVLFADDDSAKRAIVGKGRPFGPVDEALGVDLSNLNNLPFLWHKGEAFQRADPARKKGAWTGVSSVPLIFRMATVDDRKGLTSAKPSRHLWSSYVNGKPHIQQKRRRHAIDGDGDVVMGAPTGQRKNRGGRKLRKRLKGPNGAEVEMEDAEDLDGDPPDVSQQVQGPAVSRPDLRGTLISRQPENESDQFRLFSAKTAGLRSLPSQTDKMPL